MRGNQLRPVLARHRIHQRRVRAGPRAHQRRKRADVALHWKLPVTPYRPARFYVVRDVQESHNCEEAQRDVLYITSVGLLVEEDAKVLQLRLEGRHIAHREVVWHKYQAAYAHEAHKHLVGLRWNPPS